MTARSGLSEGALRAVRKAFLRKSRLSLWCAKKLALGAQPSDLVATDLSYAIASEEARALGINRLQRRSPFSLQQDCHKPDPTEYLH